MHSKRIQKRSIAVVAIVGALAMPRQGNGDTLHVPSEYPTIQAGMNAAQNGDTVLVADGTYTGPGNKDLSFNGRAFTLRSQNGPENCIIDCQGFGRAFWFFGAEGPGSVVEGFTVTGANGNPGGAFYCYYNADPTISHCIIKGNTSNSGGPGGAFYCTIAAPTITNCTITGNAAGSGGAVYAEFGSNPTLTHCVIADNSADTSAGGIYIAGDSTATLSNSILWNNELEQIYEVDPGTVTASYSDVQGGWPGAGNMDTDPLFVNADARDYHLSPDSPGIDAGNPDFVPQPDETDLDGHARVLCERVDMGVYESGIGDADCDRDVDWADLAALQRCFTGAGGGLEPGCEAFDFEGDNSVTLDDFAAFLLIVTGPL